MEKETVEKLKTALAMFKKSSGIISGLWDYTNEEKIAGILDEDYPFSGCFHELHCDIATWVETVNEALEENGKFLNAFYELGFIEYNHNNQDDVLTLFFKENPSIHIDLMKLPENGIPEEFPLRADVVTGNDAYTNSMTVNTIDELKLIVATIKATESKHSEKQYFNYVVSLHGLSHITTGGGCMALYKVGDNKKYYCYMTDMEVSIPESFPCMFSVYEDNDSYEEVYSMHLNNYEELKKAMEELNSLTEEKVKELIK